MLMTLVFSGARSLRIITRSGYCIIPFHGGELWAIFSNAGRVMFKMLETDILGSGCTLR